MTPLHDACSSGSVNMILLLVRFGARKDAKDSKGYVPRYARRDDDELSQINYRVSQHWVTGL